MRRLSKNAPCPCGSGRKAKGCCEPVLQGTPAPTPEALMRSRYTAYATGSVGHLVRTTAPSSPHWQPDVRTWSEELERYCAQVSFEGLDVRSASQDGDRGEVSFFARLRVGEQDASFGEHSRFVRDSEGRWLYVDGDRITD
jgi:SEC-C motif-containing protein